MPLPCACCSQSCPHPRRLRALAAQAPSSMESVVSFIALPPCATEKWRNRNTWGGKAQSGGEVAELKHPGGQRGGKVA